MGNFGTGFAAFANGFTGGLEMGDRIYQRNLDRKRQEKLDAYMEQEQARAAERFGWDRTNQQQLQRQRGLLLDNAERETKDANALRDAWGRSVDATEGAMGAVPPPTEQPRPLVGAPSLGAMPQTSPTPRTADNPQGIALPDIGAVRRAAAGNPPQGQDQGSDGASSSSVQPTIPPTDNMTGAIPYADGSQQVRPTGAGQEQSAPVTAPVPHPDPRRAAAPESLGAAPATSGTSASLFSKAADGKFEARAPTTRAEAIAILKASQDGFLTPAQTESATKQARAALEKGTLTADEQKYIATGPRFVEGPNGVLLDGNGSFYGVEPAPDKPYQWGRPGGLVSDARRAAGTIGAGAADIASRTAEAAVNQGADIVAGVNAPFQAASVYATGKDYIGAPGRVDLNGDNTKQSVVSPFIEAIPTGNGAAPKPGAATPNQPTTGASQQLGAVPVPKDASPAEARVVTGAVTAMNALGDQPDMKAAADATPIAALGAKPGQPMTKAQVTTGAKTFMESWRQNGAPIIQRELIRQGRIKEAQDLEKWLKSDQAQAGMNAWAKGAFLAMTGDVSGSLDALADAFNATGYYDDGFLIDKEKSEILKDERGDPAGVRVVFRNQETGEESERVMQTDDFAQMALLATAPSEAFKASIERQKAIQEQLIKADEERRKAGIDLVKSNYAAINKAAAEIYKNSIGLDGKPTMTFDEALAEAQSAYNGNQAEPSAPAADVPVLRRAP